MKAYYELKDYNKAVAAATEVLAMPDITDRVKSDAMLIEARSAMETGNEQKAKEAYQRVAKLATGRIAAEALYYDAYFKKDRKSTRLNSSHVAISYAVFC